MLTQIIKYIYMIYVEIQLIDKSLMKNKKKIKITYFRNANYLEDFVHAIDNTIANQHNDLR